MTYKLKSIDNNNYKINNLNWNKDQMSVRNNPNK